MSTSLLLLAALGVVAIVVAGLARMRRKGGGDGNVMKELRLRVLRDVPEGVGTAGTDEPLVVVMDIGFPNATASVFAALTGDASLYISSGGGVIGGIGHENVRRAAIAFVSVSARYLDQMAVTSDFPYPPPAHVRFYVRTREAVYVAERLEQDLGEKRDALWPLFYAGQNVLTELRTVAPDFGKSSSAPPS
jgi:hypothetical protein